MRNKYRQEEFAAMIGILVVLVVFLVLLVFQLVSENVVTNPQATMTAASKLLTTQFYTWTQAVILTPVP